MVSMSGVTASYFGTILLRSTSNIHKSGTITFGLSGRPWSKFGAQLNDQDKKTTPNWTFAIHLQTATAPHQPPHLAKSRYVTVKVLGAPGSSRRLPEMTHEVFSWTRSCVSAAEQKKSQYIYFVYICIYLIRAPEPTLSRLLTVARASDPERLKKNARKSDQTSLIAFDESMNGYVSMGSLRNPLRSIVFR